MRSEPAITAEAAKLQNLAGRYQRNCKAAASLVRVARMFGIFGGLSFMAFIILSIHHANEFNGWISFSPSYWLIGSALLLSLCVVTMQLSIRLQSAEREIAIMVADCFR